MLTERTGRAVLRRSGYTAPMTDPERPDARQRPEWTEQEPDTAEDVTDDVLPGDGEPGDGSIGPLRPDGDVDALRTAGPGRPAGEHDEAVPLPLETPRE